MTATVDQSAGPVPRSPWSALRQVSGLAKLWLGRNAVVIALTFAATLIVYSSLASGVVLTNHTIPNAWARPYPSFKTWGEGRWLADLLIQLFGGGSQAFEAVAGFAIQALNGAIVAEIWGVRGRWYRLLIALLVALHPTLLDYYGFTSDNIGFALGETLLLVSLVATTKLRSTPLAVLVSALLVMLALSIYQPKIAVAAVLYLGWMIYILASRPLAQVLRQAAPRAALGLALGALLYLLLSRLLITLGAGPRTHLNTPAEILSAIGDAYVRVPLSFFEQSVQMPALATVGVCLVVVLGGGRLLMHAARRGLASAVLLLLLVCLLPPAIRLSFIVNSEGWEEAGRLAVGYAYALALFAAAALGDGRWRRLGIVSVIAVLYGFALLAVQENSFMAMKTLFETEGIDRVVARIEDVLPDQQKHPIVVIGDLPEQNLNRFLEFPRRPYRPQIWQPSFILYRQVEVANFLLGRDVIAYPSPADVAAALAVAPQHPLWPLAGSVFLTGQVVVVNFAPYAPGVHVTTPAQ